MRKVLFWVTPDGLVKTYRSCWTCPSTFSIEHSSSFRTLSAVSLKVVRHSIVLSSPVDSIAFSFWSRCLTRCILWYFVRVGALFNWNVPYSIQLPTRISRYKQLSIFGRENVTNPSWWSRPIRYHCSWPDNYIVDLESVADRFDSLLEYV